LLPGQRTASSSSFAIGGDRDFAFLGRAFGSAGEFVGAFHE
jgi:hypothetical protein